MVATLWHHKIEKADCEKIITACAGVASDDVNERLARVEDVYKETDQISYRDYHL